MFYNTSVNSYNKSLRRAEEFYWKGYLERRLSLKKEMEGKVGEREKVILLSFDKTIEPLMCAKEMKGKSVSSFI